MFRRLIFLVTLSVRALRAIFRTREELLIENLALRQQVAAPKKERSRPVLDDLDRAFWVALRTAWPGWTSRLVIVKPDCIHGELMKLGFVVSQITVTRHMPRRPTEPARVKRWMAFLRNHKDAIAAMDVFAVPTASLRMLYVLFVIEHGRRRVMHFNVTSNPTSSWAIQQLREAFPFDTAPKHLLFDRDTIFSPAVVRFVKAMGSKPTRTAYRCPWQNPVAERWIGSCRRELLDHVVILGERHLLRLLRSYLS